MNDLIQIKQTQIGAENVNSVNSREIYTYLEIDTKYNDWINRAIDKYDFEENVDYSKMSNGTARGIDYIVSIDMAKELCMVSNTPKGKETRKYFISVEKQSQKTLTIPEQIQLIAQGNQIIDERLTVLEETRRLENWQEKSLKDAVSVRAYAIAGDKASDKAYVGRLHRKIWSLFKKRYFLPRYNELPSIKYQEGLEFINRLDYFDMV